MCACFKSLLQKQMLQPVTTFWELQDEKGKSIGDKGGASSSDLYRSMFFFYNLSPVLFDRSESYVEVQHRIQDNDTVSRVPLL